MAKWVHSDVLDNGISAIKANVNKQVLLKAYTIRNNTIHEGMAISDDSIQTTLYEGRPAQPEISACRG